MNVDTIHEQLDAPVTRRRIVKTGVKLAYVAPIVAASFKLSGGPAGAVSTTACTGGDCLNAGLCETASGLFGRLRRCSRSCGRESGARSETGTRRRLLGLRTS